MSKIMLHLVANFPSPVEFLEVLKVFLEHQVPYLEIQLPYYNPLGDGPQIFEANKKSLDYQSDLASIVKAVESIYNPDIHPTKLIFMSYFTPIFGLGLDTTIKLISKSFQAVIIPDLNFGTPYHIELDKLCRSKEVDIIPVISHNLSPEKLALTKSYLNPSQLVYCIARFGKTGQTTDLNAIQEYLDFLQLELQDYQIAIGFGINSKTQINFLNQQNLVAVIGTETIRQINYAKQNNLNLTNHTTNYINQLTQ
jgi:tryptophan synthase alpha chain